MTNELKHYIDGLLIQVYRMSDGSLVLSEESHRDTIDNYVVLHRPLQMIQAFDGESMKTMFIPWIPGGDDHVRVYLDNVVAEIDASFDQKLAYSRFYLIDHLQKYLSPAELKEAIMEQAAIDQKAKSAGAKASASIASSLKAKLEKGKRFHLN